MNETSTKIKIGIQGYPGSFHQEAAKKYYGGDIEVAPSATFPELINQVASNGDCDEVVMAIENSIAGSILPNYKLLEKSPLRITGEVYLKINHHLLGVPRTRLAEIREVHSHPMAILQTTAFFENHPQIRLVESVDTALSAKKVAESGNKHLGAIASQTAAELYGLDIIAKNIETVPNNYTRFLVLSKSDKDNSNADKASILFELPNTPGSLARVLSTIYKGSINISKIQSVPVVLEEWRYTFHLDLEFSSIEQYELVMKQLNGICKNLQVLGIYKSGEK
ncbi:MAG: prephenate dehydratase [Fulvivirga sp.]